MLTMDTVGSASVAVFLTGFLVFIFYSTWRKTGIWFNPSSLFALFWIVYFGIPIIVGLGYSFNPVALLYIVIFISLFSLSTFLFDWNVAINDNIQNIYLNNLYIAPFLIVVFLFFVILSVFFHAIDLLHQGISLSSDFLSIGGKYTGLRYAGDLNQNVFAKIALLTSYQSAVLGGLVFGGKSRRSIKTLILMAAMLPSILVMLLQSAKGLFFLSSAFFAGSWLVTRIFQNDFRFPQISLFQGIAAFLALSTFVITSFISRIGLDFNTLRFYIASYSSGHLYAFSDWFSHRYFETFSSNNYEQLSLEGGFYTFMAFFKFFGDSRYVPMGIYDEFFEVPGLLQTNIFTVFRGLISDFGLFGSLIFAAFVGLVSNLVFYVLVSNKNSTIGMVFFIYSVGFLYQTYIVSSLSWLSIPVSFFLTIFILSLNNFYLMVKIKKVYIV